VEDYGLLQLIAAFASYFILPSKIFPYWITRFVARGFKASKTGLIVNLLLSIPSFALFLLASSRMAPVIGANIVYFIAFAFQLPLMYVVTSLEAIGTGAKPHVLGYGYSVFEGAKVILCVLMVVALNFRLLGVIVAIVASYIIQSLALLLMLRGVLTGRFDPGLVRRWTKMSWLPLYHEASAAVYMLIFLTLTWFTRSTEPVALMVASEVATIPIVYTSFLAGGLYPRLLSGGGRADIESSLKLVLMLAIPATVGTFILAQPILRILRPEYAVASFILMVLTVKGFIKALAGIPSAIILGVERVDVDERPSFRDYVKSKLFLLPTLAWLANGVSATLMLIIAWYGVSRGMSYITLVFNYVLTDLLIVGIPFNVYLWLVSRRMAPFKLPTKSISRYSFSAAIMALFLILFYPKISGVSLAQTLLATLPIIGGGAVIYFSILLAIDKESRFLARSLIGLILATVKRL